MEAKSLTFFEHLEELRRRLLISLIAFSVAAGVGYLYSDKALRFLMRPITAHINEIYFFSPAEAFLVKVKVALFLGVIGASPVIASQLWLFVSPALRPVERKAIWPLIILTTVLFLTGVCVSFFAVSPMALNFLVGMQNEFLKPMISITEYLNFLTGMLLAFGVAFNLPVVIMGLVFAGILNAKTLNQYQRHVIVLIFVAAAILTPGPDIASQLFLALPLVALFELSVLGALLIAWMRRKDKK